MASSVDWYACIPSLALLLVVFLRFALIKDRVTGCPAEYRGLESVACCMSAASRAMLNWPAFREGNPRERMPSEAWCLTSVPGPHR